MAADRIVVNRTKQDGNNLVRVADLLFELCNLIDKINLNAGHGHDGATYTVMETDFGLVAGSGANCVTLIALINTIFNTATDVTGANRQSQVREFIGRISGQ